MNDFESKKKIVLSGNSKIFKNWSAHSSITKEDFLDALEWVCNDPLNEKNKTTRAIGLTPSGVIKLSRVYDRFGYPYLLKDGKSWIGEYFKREPLTEHEKNFCLEDNLLTELHKISISCYDRV